MVFFLDLCLKNDTLLRYHFGAVTPEKEKTMKNRNKLSQQQRTARSQLARIVHDKNYLRAAPVTMSRVCGNPNCHCAQGEKHVSLYLSRSVGGKTQKLFVPEAYAVQVREWIGNYRRIRQLLEQVSDDLWQAVKERRPW